MPFLKNMWSVVTDRTEWLRPVQLENMEVESVFSRVRSNYFE
jgi:hypothetical protein